MRNLVACKIAVKLANNEIVWAIGKGKVMFTPLINGSPGETLCFTDVLYVPTLQNNLFSILTVVQKSKMCVVIEGKSLDFSKNGQLLLTASIIQNTGMLNGITHDNTEIAYTTSRILKELLHQWLSHIGKDRLDLMIRQNLANSIVVHQNSDLPDVCEHCIAEKQHWDPFPTLFHT
jgi:hypothetical protein